MVFITSYNPVSLTIIAQVQGCHVPRPITAFDEVGFPEYLMLSIRAQGFPSPTPVQCQGWLMALSGRNMVAIAQTGSGKAIVFALPAMLHINAYVNCVVVQAISLHFFRAPPAKLCWCRVMALSLLYLLRLANLPCKFSRSALSLALTRAFATLPSVVGHPNL
jgi:hypothetical protein